MTKEEPMDIDLMNTWKALSEEKFINHQIQKEDIMKTIKSESHSDISLLKKRLKHKLYYCVGFIILFIVLSIKNIENRDLSLLFGIFGLAYILGFIPMFLKYRQVENGLNENVSILNSMKQNLKMIQSVLKLEMTWGLIIFIPAVIGGVLLGKLESGMTLIECFSDSKTLLMMIIMSAILVPIMIWLSMAANKKVYGSLIENLKSNIVRLERIV